MHKISDYSMLDILQVAGGIETMRTGNNDVCRYCPDCHNPAEKVIKGNHTAQVNGETLYCFTCEKTWTRTEIITILDLWNMLDIPKFVPSTDEFKRQSQIEYKPAKPPKIKKEPDPAEQPAPKITKKIVYEYKDLQGNILYFRDRVEYENGEKNVYYRGKAENQKPVFYGLETLSNPQNLKFIFFVEGAKCADVLRKAMSDSKYAENTAVLAFDYPHNEWQAVGQEAQNIILSKNIIIFADHDTPGRKKANELINHVKTARILHIVDFADKDKGYDIADFIEDGGTVNQALLKYAKLYKPEAEQEPEPEHQEPAEPEQEIDYNQFLVSNLIKNIKPIIEKRILGLKIQYQSILGIFGATSAGKTDIALQVLQEHANLDNCISLYLYYEGLPNEIAIRADKKRMSGNNVYALNALTDFRELEKFINHFRDKKILIVTDYVQALAWNLYLNSPDKKSAVIREFTTQIYIEQNKLRVKYDNICFYNNYILSNDGMREMRQQQSVDPFIALNSAKEDGNIAFQVDYGYTILFSDDLKIWKLGRMNLEGKIKKYVKLATAKPDRVGMETGNPIYTWEQGQYKLVDNNNININKDDYYDKEMC